MSIFDRFKKEQEGVDKKSQAPKTARVKKADAKPAAKKKVAKTKVKGEVTKKKAAVMLSHKATSTILAPLVSEKTAHLADQNVLVFKVSVNANRIEVRNAFRELYHVTPLRVNIVNARGKYVRFGRVEGKQANTKKAFVFLPKGVHVDIFEGV